MNPDSMPSRGSGLSQSSQRDILVHISQCPTLFHLIRTGKILQEDLTGNINRFIFVAFHSLLDTSTTFSEPIPKFLLQKELVEMCRAGEILPEEVPRLSAEVEEIYSSPISPAFFDEPYIMSMVRRQRMVGAIGAAAGGDVDPVEFHRSVAKIINESAVGKAGDEETGMLDRISDEEAESLMPQAGVEKIPLGIPSLDFRLNGGLAPRKSGMLCAYTGVGKSAWTTHTAWSSARAAFPTLIFSTELGKEEFYRRTLANALNVSYQVIEHGARDSSGQPIDRTDLNRALNNTKRQMMERHESIRVGLSMLQIVRMPDATVDDYVRKVLEVSSQFMDRFGIPLRAVFLDWLDKMQPIRIRGKDPALRHYLAAISQEVADFGKANNLVTWMTTQANDKAAGQAKVGLSANNESRAKANPVALYIGLGTTEEDKSNRIWHATVDKNRDGQTFSMRILGDLDHQRFGDLSEEMAAAGPPPGLRIREQRRQQARN